MKVSYKNSNHIFSQFVSPTFFGAPIICPEWPPWALPQYAARDRWPIVFHLLIPPPDKMFPADESYCNAVLPGALLVHLVLNT